jgi:hypothetical protein
LFSFNVLRGQEAWNWNVVTPGNPCEFLTT